MGALSNDSHVLARYAGFYKGVQSAGAAIAWDIDAKRNPLMTQFIVNWVLLTASLPFSFIVARGIKDTSEVEHEKGVVEQDKA
ncbi:hypothetical protein K7432_017698 [Basidiobolus ranarum]|uniref:Uncharacterized protein n=1 Tax=Basidiobolus ranarum TaxID=34480 RepID=A0ABR2VK10_9FUNG